MKSTKLKILIQYFTKAFGKLKVKEQQEFWDYLFYNYNVPPSKHPPKKKDVIVFNYKIGIAKSKKGSDTMLDLTITNEQKISISVKPVTATGKPAALDGAPTWTVQSGDSAVSVAADGLSASLISADTPGDTTYLVEADADLGSGVETISDTITLHVLGANASNLGLVAGTAEPKP